MTYLVIICTINVLVSLLTFSAIAGWRAEQQVEEERRKAIVKRKDVWKDAEKLGL
jgi:hypothetical protein